MTGSPHILVFPEEGTFVALWLEHFFAAHGATVDGAIANLVNLLTLHVVERCDASELKDVSDVERVFADVERAPQEYWERLNSWTKVASAKQDPHLVPAPFPAFPKAVVTVLAPAA